MPASRMASINSEVATGRRMNGRDGLIAGSSSMGHARHGRNLAAAFATALTDSSGAYRLLGFLWPAERGVTVTAFGFRPERTTGGRVVLHRWPWISGTVTDDVGDVVSGATVTVSQRDRGWRERSDDDGRFGLVAEAASGPAVVTAAAPDHDTATRRITVGLDHEVSVAPVLARAGFQEIDIRYRAPYPEHEKLQPVSAPREAGVPGSSAIADWADTLNANVEKINRLLFTWLDYAAIGRRP